MSLIDLFEKSLNNPLLLTFLAVWIIGWFLKNKSNINNKRIPLIITPLGILLGIFIIETSIKGALIGLLISGIQMGGYDLVKSIKEFIKFIFKPLVKDKKINIVIPENTEDDEVLPPDDII